MSTAGKTDLDHGGGSCPGGTEGLCAALLDTLALFEEVQRKYHPAMMERHGAVLREKVQTLREAVDAFLPDTSEGEALLEASRLVVEGADIFTSPADLQPGLMNALRAGRKVCRAYEVLFGLRHEIRAIDGLFREETWSPIAGDRLVHLGQDSYARGSASLYVPAGGEGPRPLIIALHGGHGHGRDFIWTWMRQARSRGIFLLAPTSMGATWSITNPAVDFAFLQGLVDRLAGEYPIDRTKILLSGLSDGATFCLACAMEEGGMFGAFNPVSGVLPPGDFSRVKARRIFWLHGAYDWMFPVSRARWGREVLSRSGAEVRLEILEDLAHAFPKEKNPAVLSWFDPHAWPGA